MNKEKIGKYIKFLRERNNLTQEELAKKVPVTREAVSKWETGRRIPDIETLIILSKIFNLSIESLLSGEESNNAVVNLYKDNIKLHKKVGILLLVTILIIITFLIYFFFNNYNSFKFYNLTGGNDNFILENSVMFVSKEKLFISIPKVSSINSDEINYKKVYYLDNKNEKHLIFEGNSDVLNYSENNGYNESINFKNLDNIINNLYIDIYYEDNIDTVKINLFLKYKNKGASPTAKDLKLVENLLVDLELTPAVVNVLLDYCLRKNNNRLTTAYVETIAGQWKRADLKTAEEAMKFAEKEHKKLNKKITVSNKKISEPAWFNTKIEKNDATEEEQKELTDLLKEFK